MHYVYILYSPTIDKYYIGYSADADERLYKHNTKHKGFTAQANDWQIVYKEAFNIKDEEKNKLKRGKAGKPLRI